MREKDKNKVIEEEKVEMREEEEENLLRESILVVQPESILFLKTHIENALGRRIRAKLLLRGTRDGISSRVFH